MHAGREPLAHRHRPVLLSAAQFIVQPGPRRSAHAETAPGDRRRPAEAAWRGRAQGARRLRNREVDPDHQGRRSGRELTHRVPASDLNPRPRSSSRHRRSSRSSRLRSVVSWLLVHDGEGRGGTLGIASGGVAKPLALQCVPRPRSGRFCRRDATRAACEPATFTIRSLSRLRSNRSLPRTRHGRSNRYHGEIQHSTPAASSAFRKRACW
jgi:hypothetical protein